jgi:SAM-dependent methyltransferase
MPPPVRARGENEIAHGRKLAGEDPELVWGWGTPAGRLRAARRGALVAEAAGLTEGTHALEVGCGSGLFTEMFAARGARLLAVDISPDLLEYARRRGLPAGRVEFREVEFERCALDGPFDAVIGSSVLHHLEQPAALGRMFDLLRPGGVLSFAEPNLLNPQVFAERTLRFLPCFRYVSPDETAFVRWRLARTLREVGFVEVSIRPFDWLHPSTPRPLIPLVRALGAVLERLPLAREFAGSLCIRAIRP